METTKIKHTFFFLRNSYEIVVYLDKLPFKIARCEIEAVLVSSPRRCPMRQRATYAEVSLDAIVRNLDRVRACTGKETEIMAVVKADAYGHGALPVARALVGGGAGGVGGSPFGCGPPPPPIRVPSSLNTIWIRSSTIRFMAVPLRRAPKARAPGSGFISRSTPGWGDWAFIPPRHPLRRRRLA